MKFLKRIALAPTHQDRSTFRLKDALLKQLYHWISTTPTLLSSVASRNRLRQLFSKLIPPPGTAVQCNANKSIQPLFSNDNISWVRTDQHLQPLTNSIKNYSPAHQVLASQSILCVGGRAALYADYRQLIEAAGGQLIIFRSGAQDNTDYLATLLKRVNNVICPVDCINHADFFTVKQYCLCTGKYCIMLQRSDLITFRKAVAILLKNNLNLKSKTVKTHSDNDNYPSLSTTSVFTG